MSKLFVSEHPLIHTKMAMLRNKETGTKEFREIIGEVASLLFYEATRELPLTEVAVQTPMAATICKTIDTKLEPVEYYCKLPADVQERTVLLTDPMLATGGSADMAIDALKKRGVKKIIFLCILAAPDGVERLQKNHPDVDIYAAAYDSKLNEHGYIVPGLGDAGDRIFGTK